MKIKCTLSSNKLFEKDKSMELESLSDEIKSEIKIYYEDKTKEFGKLQNKLIIGCPLKFDFKLFIIYH
jgi:hypothetical protein